MKPPHNTKRLRLKMYLDIDMIQNAIVQVYENMVRSHIWAYSRSWPGGLEVLTLFDFCLLS